jgi:SAM-dependent methyltransferase
MSQTQDGIKSGTDVEWEKWGQQDPYFAVLTNPKFRASVLTEEAKKEFFAQGRMHVDYVLQVCRNHIDPNFNPARVLDFGCGVGRLVIPFAQRGATVVGVDISPAMLREARLNCEAAGVEGVDLMGSDDLLSTVVGRFDLVHTCIVLQHIEIERGLRILRALLSRVRPGGLGAIHITFAWSLHESSLGVPPPIPQTVLMPWWRRWMLDLKEKLSPSASPWKAPSIKADPEMQMNYYNLSQVMFLLHRAGVTELYSQISDHGGALGTFMFFRLPEKSLSE